MVGVGDSVKCIKCGEESFEEFEWKAGCLISVWGTCEHCGHGYSCNDFEFMNGDDFNVDDIRRGKFCESQRMEAH